MTLSRQSVELLKAAMEEGLAVPHTAAEAIASLEENHARLCAALDGLNDSDLLEMRLTNWGERWPTWRIFSTMTAHDLHHGGEIGCLRDLYRRQHQTKDSR